MFDRKTDPGMMMNPMTRTINTIVQLSPINAPLNDGYTMNLSINFILLISKSQT
jgi:hypothetical protein